MTAGKQHQWNYVSALRDETALPRGQRCTIGFTWKRNRFAIIVNDTVFPEAGVDGPPAWGPTFHFGGAGTFPGRALRSPRLLQIRALRLPAFRSFFRQSGESVNSRTPSFESVIRRVKLPPSYRTSTS